MISSLYIFKWSSIVQHFHKNSIKSVNKHVQLKVNNKKQQKNIYFFKSSPKTQSIFVFEFPIMKTSVNMIKVEPPKYKKIGKLWLLIIPLF